MILFFQSTGIIIDDSLKNMNKKIDLDNLKSYELFNGNSHTNLQFINNDLLNNFENLVDDSLFQQLTGCKKNDLIKTKNK